MQFWLTLQLDLSKTAPDGPGWYAYAAREGAVIIQPQRLEKDSLEIMKDAFGATLESQEIAPSQIIESGENLIRQAIREQLQEAEAQALRIAKLRKLAATLEENQEKEESQ